jgi:dihydrofolate synthase/folylpolyglutamate synthase
MYQRDGKSAFKKDLTNIRLLCQALDNPQDQFKSIHIAGTNGKGSSAHMIASVLQEAGYKIGLYTSPHLKNFTERIKLNGTEIAEENIVEFVSANRDLIDEINPSFFEITVAMAFWYFARQSVDFAIVEVGLGGRLDSTNIIVPEVSLITNISLDHTEMLGSSIESIAYEKAGIVKEHIPVVIGEYLEESAKIFQQVADDRNSDILYANKKYHVEMGEVVSLAFHTTLPINIDGWPEYQKKNIPGILTVLDVLKDQGVHFTTEEVKTGIESFKINTGLKGRWQTLALNPLTICDTAHNVAGIKVIVEELSKIKRRDLYIVWGMVVDKEIKDMLELLPEDVYFYFCRPDIPRGMNAETLYKVAKEMGLKGEIIEDVNKALATATSRANPDDMIYVGGSTFVVAELKDL